MNVSVTYLTNTVPILSFKCTVNNTLATFVDNKGSQVTTISSGQLNYKGSNKGSGIASQHVIATIGNFVLNKGYHKIVVKVSGFGKGRNFIVKELTKLGLTLVDILDQNKVAFNGCRNKKSKR